MNVFTLDIKGFPAENEKQRKLYLLDFRRNKSDLDGMFGNRLLEPNITKVDIRLNTR